MPASGFREVLVLRGEDYAARGIDDHALTAAVFARLHNLFQVAALRANTRKQDGYIRGDEPDFAQFVRLVRADDEAAVVAVVPLVHHATRDELIKPHAFFHK